MGWTQEKINEIYAEVQRTASTDEEFRKELLEDASKAIEKIAGEPLPEGYKVKVVENDPAYAATFVLPPMVSDELSGDDLDAVAGGLCAVDGSCAANACAGKVEK
ncbi:NHLP leader peptide family RiPP precursor [Luxibacter massiliensis]|mgnify:CR=1|uniref:NHLP leader peptide family RiPP precursor n=1 Tax=Luxibacter massiliensis TaxID=2219695 RepID=UPI000F046DB4|nr:NHLP leader peptide family RiPP precursor [Luxibacter massiliensis]